MQKKKKNVFSYSSWTKIQHNNKMHYFKHRTRINYNITTLNVGFRHFCYHYDECLYHIVLFWNDNNNVNFSIIKYFLWNNAIFQYRRVLSIHYYNKTNLTVPVLFKHLNPLIVLLYDIKITWQMEKLKK